MLAKVEQTAAMRDRHAAVKNDIKNTTSRIATRETQLEKANNEVKRAKQDFRATGGEFAGVEANVATAQTTRSNLLELLNTSTNENVTNLNMTVSERRASLADMVNENKLNLLSSSKTEELQKAIKADTERLTGLRAREGSLQRRIDAANASKTRFNEVTTLTQQEIANLEGNKSRNIRVN